jgi:hypothetical protein
MGFESTSELETKEFCGAAWPSTVLKREGILGAPLLPLEKFTGDVGKPAS